MPQITLNDVSIAYGERKLLRSINSTIAANDKIALTGPNGSGKSTIMKILVQHIQQDSGSVVSEKGTTVSYLPQSNVVFSDTTLFEEAERAFQTYHDVHQEMRKLEENFSSQNENNSNRLDSLLMRYANLQDTLQQNEYFTREQEIHRVLTGLGFQQNQFTSKCMSFSR